MYLRVPTAARLHFETLYKTMCTGGYWISLWLKLVDISKKEEEPQYHSFPFYCIVCETVVLYILRSSDISLWIRTKKSMCFPNRDTSRDIVLTVMVAYDSGGTGPKGQQAWYSRLDQLACTHISYSFFSNRAPARKPGSLTGDFPYIRPQLGHSQSFVKLCMRVQISVMCS